MSNLAPRHVLCVSHLLWLDPRKQVGKGAAVQMHKTQRTQDVHAMTSRWQCLITFITCPSSPSPSLYPPLLSLPLSLSCFSIFILFSCKSLETDFQSGSFSAQSQSPHHLVWFCAINETDAIFWCWSGLMYADLWIVKENSVLPYCPIQPLQFDPSAHIHRILMLSSLLLALQRERGRHS